jgi:aminoglycoside phosphotransferase (APT) family kinase protein
MASIPLAPRALFFCGDRRVLGAPFQITEYRPGVVIRDTLPPGFADRPQAGTTLSRQLVEPLAALHAVDPRRSGSGRSATQRDSSPGPSRVGQSAGRQSLIC